MAQCHIYASRFSVLISPATLICGAHFSAHFPCAPYMGRYKRLTPPQSPKLSSLAHFFEICQANDMFSSIRLKSRSFLTHILLEACMSSSNGGKYTRTQTIQWVFLIIIDEPDPRPKSSTAQRCWLSSSPDILGKYPLHAHWLRGELTNR